MNDNNLYSRKVLVTGATGMLGSHLVGQMLVEGYNNIVLVVRSRARLENMTKTLSYLGLDNYDDKIHIVECSLSDDNALDDAMRGVHTVFNCAARIMSGELTTEELIYNNVSIARSVVDSCLRTGVVRLIHVSSISALGVPAGGGVVIDENCQPEDITQDAAYGQSKYYSEQQVWLACDEGLQVIVVSPGVILGEGDWSSGGSSALIPIICSGLPLYTLGVMSYVDVRDVARAMTTLDGCETAVGNRFILSAGDLTYKELIGMGAAAADRRRPFIKVGSGAVSVAYGAMRCLIALRIMKGRGVTKRNLGSVVRGNRYDGSKITKFCEFRYTPLNETIDRVVKAYRIDKKRKSE